MLRSRRARREDSFATHLPDPVVIPDGDLGPEQEALLADSVGLALLVVLDRLTPAERLVRYAEHGPVIYLETFTTSVFLDSRGDVDTYGRVLARLSRIAMSMGESRDFLAHLASEHDQPEEGHDDRA